MRNGSHDDPVRPRGASKKRPPIPPVQRFPITYRASGDERAVWLRRR